MRIARRIGLNRRIKFGPNGFTYTGSYQWIDDGDENWRMKFLTSGIFKPKCKVAVDVFCVGGGGGCPNNGYGAGAGGGYTTLEANVLAVGGTSYTITVGAGGSGLADGGNSSAFTVVANGGKAPDSAGGNGGSGGGAYGANNGYGANGGVGGADGGSGGRAYYTIVSGDSGTTPGTGQGTTTREFGVTGGTLYAGGGGGASGSTATTYGGGRGGAGGAGGGGNGGGPANPSAAGNGAVNTGGGAGHPYNTLSTGGSGIVIIRNKR